MERSKGVTLDRIAAVAGVLHRFRGPIAAVGLAAAVWFVWMLIDTSVTSARALVPLTVLLWAALALGVGSMLTQAPQSIESGDGFAVRLKKRLIHAAWYVAVVVMLVLIGMTLLLSYRAWQLS